MPIMDPAFYAAVYGITPIIPTTPVTTATVPRSQSGAVPISSLLGVGSWGSGKLERVGQLGEGWGK